MASLRIWIILSWIALPTVMYGGYSLLRLLNRGDALTPFQVDCFRAGHAHAGVLLLLSLLYYMFMDRTALPVSVKQAACVGLFVGILAQSLIAFSLSTKSWTHSITTKGLALSEKS